MVLHGVSLSIGSTDPLDKGYLRELKALAERVEPAWVSDHLCWTGVDGVNLHDLLPLPYTEEALHHVVARVQPCRNASAAGWCWRTCRATSPTRVARSPNGNSCARSPQRADCQLLLDVNNVYVSGVNHGFDPLAYLRGIPVERVRQFHLAGHRNKGELSHRHARRAGLRSGVGALCQPPSQRFGAGRRR